ncbi:uncharacterized protein LTR77_007997 [Saxophila tyrrhenica]|uniref:Cytochrome P450 n=1 Tax=Saxophila tyrrhenica TaxID=1690608 RepID=A0AAV9P5F6_9PEZI|nr:hypothetical protein LTR77_007997 [Saxophila tyrrhenica]
MFTGLSTIQLLLILAGTFVIWRNVQTNLISPLCHIPGPFLARLTPYWLVFIDLAGTRTTTIHQLHQKYGPVVRIGPKELSFADQASVNEMYSQQTAFMKAEIYDSMSVKPLGIFSLRDKGLHSQRRSLLSYAFSQANVTTCAPLVHAQVAKLVGKIGAKKGMPVDMLLLFRLFSLDVVGELFLGSSFGGLDNEDPPQFLLDIDQHFLLSGIEWNFPWIYALMTILPFQGVQWFLGARRRLNEYGENAYRTYIKRFGRESGRKDLLTKILSPKDGNQVLTDRETYTEIGNLVFAGTDTTSTTLTYLFWELTRNPEWQQRIRDELRGLDRNDSSSDGVQLLKASDAPVLEAVINEALRLHPAAPASLPRATPPGGAQLGLYYIPEDTVVSAQCYTTQRDPTAFPDPDTFDPERWLKNEQTDPKAKDLFMPFSKGTRACLGRPLAMMELREATSALLLKYSVTAAPETTADSMAMRDHFLVLPKGGRCDLIFEPL